MHIYFDTSCPVVFETEVTNTLVIPADVVKQYHKYHSDPHLDLKYIIY